MPWFEPALDGLDLEADRQAVYDVKYAEGDTHIQPDNSAANTTSFPIRRTFYNNVSGRDYTQDLSGLRAVITEAICAGASRGLPERFHDSVGDGWRWHERQSRSATGSI